MSLRMDQANKTFTIGTDLNFAKFTSGYNSWNIVRKSPHPNQK